MPSVTVMPAADLHYVIDDFTDPWTQPETVLLVHGLAECTEAWRAWVPHLARHFRVIRLDQRGFGKSTPMREDFRWSVDTLAGDLSAIVDRLAPEGVHLVAAKVAGPIAVRTARTWPGKIRSLTLVGTPVVGPTQPDWLAQVEQDGVGAWARTTMDARLDGMSREAKNWWIEMMAATPRSTMLGFLRFVSSIDVRDDLPLIQCPTLVISSDSARRPIATVTAWQSLIPNSTLVQVAGSGYHAAATQADDCAAATAKFIASHARKTYAFRRSHDIRIDAPAGAVFDYVCNPNSWPEWITASHEMHSANRPLGTGETFREEWHTRTGPVELNWVVRESDRPRRWIAETYAQFIGRIIVRYDFEERDGGCRYTRTLVNPARPKAPTDDMVRRIDEEAAISLANIKRRVEERIRQARA